MLRDGRTVAVKVQYPGIDDAVRADLRNLSMFRWMLHSSLPWVTPALLDELRRSLEGELDYVVEAATHSRIAALFADHPFLVVPPTVPDLCRPRCW